MRRRCAYWRLNLLSPDARRLPWRRSPPRSTQKPIDRRRSSLPSILLPVPPRQRTKSKPRCARIRTAHSKNISKGRIGCGRKLIAPGQLDLFRGLADIFSRGMDTLTHRLNQEGYSARVYSTNQWPSAAQRIADQYSRRHKVIVVLVGHSLGGNAIFDAAYELDQRNVPIE